MDLRRGVIDLHNPKALQNEPNKTFTFDAIYDWKCVLVYVHTYH